MRKLLAALATVWMMIGVGGCAKQQKGAPVVPPPAQTPQSVADGEKTLPPVSPKPVPAAPSNEAPAPQGNSAGAGEGGTSQ